MKLKFLPINKEIEINPNKTVLQAATENGIEIKSICKGVPACAECRVTIAEGERNVLPPTQAEINLIGTSYYLESRRLSCQLRCFGDVTIDLKEQIERSEQQTKKIRGFKVDKATESHAVQDTLILSEPTESAAPSQNSKKN